MASYAAAAADAVSGCRHSGHAWIEDVDDALSLMPAAAATPDVEAEPLPPGIAALTARMCECAPLLLVE